MVHGAEAAAGQLQLSTGPRHRLYCPEPQPHPQQDCTQAVCDMPERPHSLCPVHANDNANDNELTSVPASKADQTSDPDTGPA